MCPLEQQPATPEATVAVPVKDRRERMLRCLAALATQDHPSYEIIVIDNASTDGTAEACRDYAATVGVPIRVEVVPGTLGHARNAAARLARGRYLAYTDSDCTPVRGWLSAAVAALEADPSVGLVCGMTLPANPPKGRWARFVEVRELTWRFESCNIAFRTDAFRASEGFDEVVGYLWEDTAAGFSLLRTGWRTAFAPAATVYHDVTYPGFWWHIRREQRQRNLARVVKRFPESRRRLLFGRVFFSGRSAAWLLAFAGLAASPAVPRARWLALPYLPFMLRTVRPLEMGQMIVYDGAVNLALVRGALRYRTLLL